MSEIANKTAGTHVFTLALWFVPVWWGRQVGSHPVCGASQGQIFCRPLSWNWALGHIHSCHSDETVRHSDPSPPQQSGNSTQLNEKEKKQDVLSCFFLFLLIDSQHTVFRHFERMKTLLKLHTATWIWPLIKTYKNMTSQFFFQIPINGVFFRFCFFKTC